MADAKSSETSVIPDAGNPGTGVPAGDVGTVAAAAPAVPSADTPVEAAPATPVTTPTEKVEAAPEKVEAKFESTPSLLTAAEGKPDPRGQGGYSGPGCRCPQGSPERGCQGSRGQSRPGKGSHGSSAPGSCYLRSVQGSRWTEAIR